MLYTMENSRVFGTRSSNYPNHKKTFLLHIFIRTQLCSHRIQWLKVPVISSQQNLGFLVVERWWWFKNSLCVWAPHVLGLRTICACFVKAIMPVDFFLSCVCLTILKNQVWEILRWAYKNQDYFLGFWLYWFAWLAHERIRSQNCLFL